MYLHPGSRRKQTVLVVSDNPISPCLSETVYPHSQSQSPDTGVLMGFPSRVKLCGPSGRCLLSVTSARFACEINKGIFLSVLRCTACGHLPSLYSSVPPSSAIIDISVGLQWLKDTLPPYQKELYVISPLLQPYRKSPTTSANSIHSRLPKIPDKNR